MAPKVLVRFCVKKDRVVEPPEMPAALFCVVVRSLTFPNDFVDELIFAKDLIEITLP